MEIIAYISDILIKFSEPFSDPTRVSTRISFVNLEKLAMHLGNGAMYTGSRFGHREAGPEQS
jgi:hypothetical protein